MPELDADWLSSKVVETTPDAVVFADALGLIRLWNAGAERIFGYTATEALGLTLDIIVPERLRQRHWDAYHAAMAAGTSKYGAGDLLAVPAVRKDGSRISIEFTISLVRDEAGRVLGPAAILRDVTTKFQELTGLRKRLAELESAAGNGAASA